MAETVFTGVREKWRPLYNELKELVRQAVGDFEEHSTASAIVWRRGTAFAEVGARAGCMVVGFPATEHHPEWHPDKVVQTSKNRFAHYFNVTAGDGLPPLAGRIAQAYQLASTTRPAGRGTAEKTSYATIDAYIAAFAEDRREVMAQVRQTIRTAAPDATERMSWQMPTFYQGENLVHFAMGKHHLGFYPGAEAVAFFAPGLTEYKTSKGAIQFPLDRPIPYDLIAEITRFRVAQQEQG